MESHLFVWKQFFPSICGFGPYNYFCKVINGYFPPINPNYKIDGRDFDWFYYLTDGIYPDWKIFMKSITEPTDRKSKLYAKIQESIRKCVERLFGVFYTDDSKFSTLGLSFGQSKK